MTLEELQTYLLREKTLQQVKELMLLMNYTSLIEKLNFTKDLSEKGCTYCRKRADNKLPLESQSILFGGEELSLDKRNELLAFSLVDAALRTVGNCEMEIFALFGSYNLLRIIQQLIGIFEKADILAAWSFNRKNFISQLYEVDRLTSRKEKLEMLEKLAALDNILNVNVNNALENISPEDMKEDLDMYIKFVEKYAVESSFDYLCRSNTGRYEYPNQKCLADGFVFSELRTSLEDETAQPQQTVPIPEIISSKSPQKDSAVEPEEILVLKSDVDRKPKRKKNK